MSPTRDQLQVLLGNCCPIPTLVASGTQEILVNAADFAKLLAHWKSQPVTIRPRLRGLTVSRAAGKARRLQLILSTGNSGVSILFSAEFEAEYQPLVELWPYAAWWEDELRSFEGVAVPERREGGGISWRRS